MWLYRLTVPWQQKRFSTSFLVNFFFFVTFVCALCVHLNMVPRVTSHEKKERRGGVEKDDCDRQSDFCVDRLAC